MSADPNHAKSIFLNAADQPAGPERDAYLAEACGPDVALRQEVDDLLAHFERVGAFLEAPAAGPTVDTAGPAETAGTAIGPYKLIEPIGEGGFGVVFLAEQQHPVRRKVALKVLKPGMDTRQVVARFEAERQALALMDHANIARVFDGGTTVSGRPYFVMELVRGVPITEYCDQNQLPPRQRLELFVSACQAVQHAHQKGVIHRDLKPSNVLVSRHDTTPVVKVIDFGVAKALGQGLTDKTLVTGLAQMVGTPLYMSPEQAGMSDLDVDTRSDIYSLGVLLYELLTGTTPFTKERFQTAGYDEIRRIIRDEDPPRPSTRISTLGVAVDTVSAKRGLEPVRLRRVVRGELDWIVMKALEKDRTRRFETASALAADVQRYLADEPVLACPPSASYRFRKFARRHRRAVLTTSVAAVAVVLAAAALVAGTLLFEREQARTADARAQAATDLAAAEAEARSRLETQLYRQLIALAEREWSVNNLSRMEVLLERCPRDLRDWEWRFLKRLRHSTQSPLRHERPVLDAAFSPDGHLLATCTQGGVVRIWREETGREIQKWQVIQKWQAHEGDAPNATTVRFSPDGRLLATGGWDKTVKVWEVEKVLRGEVERPLHRWEHTTPRVWSVAFSPDGRRLASAGGKEVERTGEVNVRDVDSGEKVFPTKGFDTGVRSVQFSPDGRRLATACGEFVQVWDAQTGEEQVLPFPCRDPGGSLEEVVFSPDGRRLAAVGGFLKLHPGRDVKVWDATTGEEVFRLPGHVGGLRCVAFSPDGRRLVSAGLDQTIKVWDTQTRDEVLTLRGHLDIVGSVAFSPDSCKLASASVDNTVRIWDATPLEGEPTSGYRTLRGHAGAVTGVGFHPKDGRTLVSAGTDGTQREWDFLAGTELIPRRRTVEAHGAHVAYSPDGRRLAVGAGPLVRVWDTTTGTEGPPFRGHAAGVNCVALSPDGRNAASADGDFIVRVWDTTTAQQIWARPGLYWPLAVAFSPDGRQLATGSADGIVRVWDWKAEGEGPAQQLEHAGRVTSVAFSRDGKRLASASWDRTVKVWDAASWRHLYDLPQPSAVQRVAFDRDGPRLAWGGTDGTVTVWDGPGTEAHVLRGHTSWIKAVAFSPKGEWIASASLDGTVKIWKAPPVAKAPAPKAGEQGD
ncbi:MAG TPA: protein kinase [Gemmataceae bacterium]|nr:protein kinase [Gemmataceae bacterium]